MRPRVRPARPGYYLILSFLSSDTPLFTNIRHSYSCCCYLYYGAVVVDEYCYATFTPSARFFNIKVSSMSSIYPTEFHQPGVGPGGPEPKQDAGLHPRRAICRGQHPVDQRARAGPACGGAHPAARSTAATASRRHACRATGRWRTSGELSRPTACRDLQVGRARRVAEGGQVAAQGRASRCAMPYSIRPQGPG